MKTLLLVACGLSALLAFPGCLRWPRETDCVLPNPQPAAERTQPLPSQPTPAAVLSPEDRIRAALSKKRVKGLSWEEVNLDEALVYLRTITGLNFYVSPKVREEKFDDVVISAELDDVSLADLLDLVLTQPYELRWDVRNDVVWILTSEEIEGPLFLRSYDVKDIVGGLPEDLMDGKAVTKPFLTGEHLADELRREVHRSYWARDDASLEARKGLLIVRASKAVHAALEQYLAAERARDRKPALPVAMQAKFDATKINLAVTEQPLGDVIKMLQIQTGFNLMIDPRVHADIAKNPISGMQLRDVPLSTALTMLASSAGEAYTWVGQGNVAVLTHREHVR